MKKIFLSVMLLVIAASYSQVLTGKVPGVNISKPEYSMNDTIIRVVYSKPQLDFTKKPAVYINGTLIKEMNLSAINPNGIELINIEKEEVEIDHIKYYGKIFIKTKDNYDYSPIPLISLNNLKAKYLSSLKGSVIFQIDNKQVIADYDEYLVNEKNILKIIVEDFENEKEKLKLHFVKLVTRTEENVKQANKIIIRGENEASVN
jgi:hypothetical protein